MAQRLKPDIRQRIHDAALRVFARQGYLMATIATIAAEAGISTGNVYRYHRGKESLLASVLPDSFVQRFMTLLQNRVQAAPASASPTCAEVARYQLFSRELLDFCIDNRERVLLLLQHPQGTPYESFPAALVRQLVLWAATHFGHKTLAMEFLLEQIYQNLIRTTVAVLQRHRDRQAIRQAVEAYSRYHLAGLRALLKD